MKFVIYSRVAEDNTIQYRVGTYRPFDSPYGIFNAIAIFMKLKNAVRMMRYLNGFSDTAPMDWGEDE